MQGAIASGTVRLIAAKLADLKIRAKSRIHSIAGLNWHLEAKLRSHDHDSWRGKQTDLEIFVRCSSERTDWSCEADIKFTLLSPRNQVEKDTGVISQKFPTEDDSVPNQVWPDVYAPFADVRGNDGIVIEATVTVNKVVGILTLKMTTLCDFTTPQPDITDVALVIGEKRLYVSKQLLALSSPVFQAMFFSEFVEKNKKEIPIEDLDFDEFLEFLHVVYPSRKAVTAATIDCLLSLGDRFNAEVVMRECEAFLCGPAGYKLPLEKRLLYADRFGLSRLQVLCLGSINTYNEANALREKKEFGELSDKMKASLLERILSLSLR